MKMKNIIEKIGLGNIIIISLAIISLVLNICKGEWKLYKIFTVALSVIILLLIIYNVYKKIKEIMMEENKETKEKKTKYVLHLHLV